jgi:hypothetical protein
MMFLEPKENSSSLSEINKCATYNRVDIEVYSNNPVKVGNAVYCLEAAPIGA